MDEEKRDEIYKMLAEVNDYSLIKPNENPDKNTIYHLYNDGRITSQFGGWAYLMRKENELKSYICKNLYLDIEKFMNIYTTGHNNFWRKNCKTYGYVVVTYEDALILRSEMEKLAEML
jgi:hypothetical protein